MRAPRRWPKVSVVVVNLNGKAYLERCLASLRGLDYPQDRLEVILIDNASTDGSVEYVKEQWSRVRLVRNRHNTGFSPAVNQGAKLAKGDYLALINNDAEADARWLREAVVVLEMHDRVACVGSKILGEDRRSIDYAGGQMAFYGHGYARNHSQADDERPIHRPTLFASGGAMVVRAELFRATGGFDPDYFAFFEDVDFGWRLWLLGHEVVYVPSSRVYHRHHGTIERFGYARERYLLERNALMTVFKNYGDETLASVLPATLILALSRGLHDLEQPLPDYRITDDATPMGNVEISAVTGAHLAAIRDFMRDLDRLRAKRKWVQTRRVRPDQTVLRLFEETFRPNVDGQEYLETFQALMATFDLRAKLHAPNRVLIITEDTIGEKMAGPAIRSWEMANLLSREHDVTLASTQHIGLSTDRFRTVQASGGLITALLGETDVVIFQGFAMHSFPQIGECDVPVVVDIYDPFHLEALTLRKDDPPVERFILSRSDVQVLNAQLERGDFLVCASEKQRDFWLGQLSGLQRINPATYDHDESLRSLLGVAPFGLPDEPPVKVDKVLRGVVPGIDEGDFLLLWGGGIYNWFDPLTLIRAIGEVAAEYADVKLFFMGSGHPNPAVPKMKMVGEAYQLAEALGLLGTHVFFNPGWVPYERRADYLLEADVGVSTHFEHIETAFSYRTRILDYLWAGLPILATEGDSLSRMVTTHFLGLVVPPEDSSALATAIKRLRNDRDLFETCKTNVEQLAPEMTWERSLAPIVEFCRYPRRAPDRVGKPFRYVSVDDVVLTKTPWHYTKRIVHYYRSGGRKLALLHMRNFVRTRLGKGSRD
ncbi:MAG: glycosyltransferase [Egibacteraceae bacterium]